MIAVIECVCRQGEELGAKETAAMILEELGQTKITKINRDGNQEGILKVIARVSAVKELMGVVPVLFDREIKKGSVRSVKTEDDGYGAQGRWF